MPLINEYVELQLYLMKYKRIQFNGLKSLFLLQQVGSISSQKYIDLFDVVLFSQLNGLVPLVQLNTTINSLLEPACLMNEK